MADTIREQIIAAMITRFQGIKKASGYKSDLGNSVHHFRGSDYDVTELPALNVVDGRNDIGPATSTQLLLTTIRPLQIVQARLRRSIATRSAVCGMR